jgi:hypothetical protein
VGIYSLEKIFEGLYAWAPLKREEKEEKREGRNR